MPIIKQINGYRVYFYACWRYVCIPALKRGYHAAEHEGMREMRQWAHKTTAGQPHA
jgi:hypothetical protein